MLKIDNNAVRYLYNNNSSSKQHKVVVNGTTVFDDTVHFDWKITYTAILIQTDPIKYQYDANVMVNSPVRNDGYPCPNIPIQIAVVSFDEGEPTRVLLEATPFNNKVATGYATYNNMTGQFEFSRDGRVITDISYLYKEIQPLPPAPPEREWVTLSDFLFSAVPVPYILEPQDTISFYDNSLFH